MAVDHPEIGGQELSPSGESGMAITFWAGALGIPSVLLIGNAVIRRALGIVQSAGADVG